MYNKQRKIWTVLAAGTQQPKYKWGGFEFEYWVLSCFQATLHTKRSHSKKSHILFLKREIIEITPL